MAEVKGFNPQAGQNTGREGGFIKEVTFLSRGKKAIKQREVPIGATVSGEISEAALKGVPRETGEEPSIVVADQTEQGMESELSSKPVTVSKERMDAFKNMDLLTLKQEMIRIAEEYKPLKNEKDDFEQGIKTFQKSADRKPENANLQKKVQDLKRAEKEWLKSNLTRIQLLEAEWNMLGDLIKAKEKVEEAA